MLRGWCTALGGVFLLAAGCDTSVERFFVPLEDGRSILLLLLGERSGTAQGFDVPSTNEQIELNGVTEAYALYYDCRLGLDERGAIRLVQDGRDIPTPLSSKRRILNGDDVWVDSAFLEFPVDSYRLDLPPPNRCRSYESTTVEVPDQLHRWAVHLGDDRVLVGLQGGNTPLAIVSPTSVEPVDVELPIPPPVIRGLRAPDGELFLFGGEQVAARGTIEGGFTRMPDLVTTSTDNPPVFTISREGETEVFVLARTGQIAALNGNDWRLIDETETVVETPDIAWVGPGQAIAIGRRAGMHEVTHITTTEAFEEPLPDPLPGDTPQALAYVDGLGVVVGTRTGRVFVDSGEGFELISSIERLTRVLEIEGLDESSFIFGGDAGFLAQFHTTGGYCAAEQLAPAGIGAIETTRSGLVLIPRFNDWDQLAPNSVIFLRELDRDSCF